MSVLSFADYLIDASPIVYGHRASMHTHTYTHTSSRAESVFFNLNTNAAHMKHTRTEVHESAVRLWRVLLKVVSEADRLLSCGGATLFVYVRVRT